MALLSIVATQARAVNTYSYTGSHSVVYNTTGVKYFTIGRASGTGAFTVHAYLSGSSKFSLYTNTAYFPDSTKDTTWNLQKAITLAFSSSIHDTSIAWLVLADSNHADTIQLTGIGPLVKTSPDFTVNDTFFYINVRRDSSGTHASALLQIKNELSTSLSLYVSPADSVHFNVDGHGGETVNLSGNGAANVYINYTPHNVSTDRTTVYVTEQSSPYEKRSITVIVVDSLYMTPTYQPTVSLTKDLGLVYPGDSACGTLLVQNNSPKSMTITNLSGSDSTTGRWANKNKPSLPLTQIGRAHV